MRREKTVESYIENTPQWAAELTALRDILRGTVLEEGIKWGAPCYMLGGKNIVGMMAFKANFGLWFHQGALLKDKAGVLINAQEGKTHALRQWRMASRDEIKPELIRQYVNEAIANGKAGKTVKIPKKPPPVIPRELSEALAQDTEVREKFEALTLGPKREFTDYISEAKQDATKQRRLAKILPMIKAGTGLNDKYK